VRCSLIKNFQPVVTGKFLHTVINLFECLEKVLSYLSSLPGKLNEAGHLLLLQTHKRATCASALAPRVALLQPRKGGEKKLR
jgi:hypothetical protein